ncbi:hypothetical protein HYV89_01990 [Candidatus Woesearchaeota archaeon]|nr:hypothetical protein [Candidatus Woesearchaeota archaeon]
MRFVLITSMLVSFFTVIYITPWLIRYLIRIGLIVKDQNKDGKPLVPISGGMAVLSGFFTGLMCFIFLTTFFPDGNKLVLDNKVLMFLLSSTISIIMITFVGFIDDLIIRRDNESSSGLKQWQKPLLTLAAAIPLMVVNSGVSTLSVPVFGRVDIGLIYPLIFIPIGVVGAANMVNMLAGFNGLETGMGIIYTGMLGVYAYFNMEGLFLAERTSAVIISAVVFSSLIAFYIFNRYPARILPGDSLTYLLGGILASIAIVGNLEKAALILSIPFLIELILKMRGRFKKQSYGYYLNGKVKSHYDKIYSLPHIFTKTGRFTEKQIVYFFVVLELIFGGLIWIV